MILLFGCVYLLWCFYACICGHLEAIYYDAVQKEVKIPELHDVYVMQRIMPFLSIAGLSFYVSGGASVLFSFSLILIFSFFHDNQYYATRNNLDSSIYHKRWMDESTTSTAIFEFSFFTRTALALIGILMLMFFIYDVH